MVPHGRAPFKWPALSFKLLFVISFQIEPDKLTEGLRQGLPSEERQEQVRRDVIEHAAPTNLNLVTLTVSYSLPSSLFFAKKKIFFV